MTAEYKKLNIDYSPMAGDLKLQLDRQGFHVKDFALLAKQENIRESILKLVFQEILTQSDALKAFKRLHKQIDKNLKDPTS